LPHQASSRSYRLSSADYIEDVRSIDLHSHILPGVDDGPPTLSGSLELARTAVAAGTGQIVATPHINEDHFISPLEVPAAVSALGERLAAARIDLVVRAGGEIAMPRLLDLQDDELDSLGLGGGPYLLLESPFGIAVGAFEPLVHDVLRRGHRVLLAHPERSPAFQRDPERLTALMRSGVLVQITAGSITGSFGERVRRFTAQLLREDLVHVVASDAHNHDKRPPGLNDAVKAAEHDVPGIADRTAWFTQDVPTAILAGEAIPPSEPLPTAKRAGWRRLAARVR
jgi:protein-tyrosine phosphatase